MSWMYKTAPNKTNHDCGCGEPKYREVDNTVPESKQGDLGCKPPREWFGDECGCHEPGDYRHWDCCKEHNDLRKDYGEDYKHDNWDWKHDDREERKSEWREPKHLECECVEVKGKKCDHHRYEDDGYEYDKRDHDWLRCWCKPCFPKPKPCGRHEYWNE